MSAKLFDKLALYAENTNEHLFTKQALIHLVNPKFYIYFSANGELNKQKRFAIPSWIKDIMEGKIYDSFN